MNQYNSYLEIIFFYFNCFLYAMYSLLFPEEDVCVQLQKTSAMYVYTSTG